MLWLSYCGCLMEILIITTVVKTEFIGKLGHFRVFNLGFESHKVFICKMGRCTI